MTMIRSDWQPDPKEVDYLSMFAGEGHEKECIVSIGYEDDVPVWRIGQVAGFGGGKIDDEGKRRSAWAAAASKSAKRKGTLHTHIVGLQKQLRQFRQDGCKPESVSRRQMIERCDHLILHGAANESFRAMDMKVKLEGYDRPTPKGEQLVAMTVARVGLEKTRIGIEALFPNMVRYLAKVDPAEAEASEMYELNSESVDLEDRLEKLEARA